MQLLLLPEDVTRAASVEGIIVIAIIYAVLTVIGKLKEAATRKELPRPVERERPSMQVRRGPPAPPPDTRSEAGKLEELLRGLGGLAGLPEEGPMGRRSSERLPSSEEFEERESLEVEERVVNLEVGRPERSKRVEVDQDEGAEALVQKRIQDAIARNRPLTQKDHQEFDQRLRTPAAKQPVLVHRGRQRLRDAIIWKEILGPPLALRDINRPEA